jgi:hypothetical protein
MKQLKQLCAVTLLVLTLGISTYAGQIDTPGYTGPPPPPAPESCDIGEPTVATPAPGTIDSVDFEEFALKLLVDVMSVF